MDLNSRHLSEIEAVMSHRHPFWSRELRNS